MAVAAGALAQMVHAHSQDSCVLVEGRSSISAGMFPQMNPFGPPHNYTAVLNLTGSWRRGHADFAAHVAHAAAAEADPRLRYHCEPAGDHVKYDIQGTVGQSAALSEASVGRRLQDPGAL